MRFSSFVLAAAVVCGWPTVGLAQVQVPSRGWFDVNFLAADVRQGPHETTAVALSAATLPAVVNAGIPERPGAIGVGAEAGLNVTDSFGIGVRY